ncbi:MAG: hypothetical protein ABIQ01_09995 [Pseudolysinimonas sp.]
MVAEIDTAALPDKAAFAAANGWRYEPSALAPAYRGSIFEYLQDATVADRFTMESGQIGASGPAVEVGVITGMVGGGQDWSGTGSAVRMSFTTNEVMSVGYLAVRLERQLPQFVLDASRNDDGRYSNLPMPIAGGQRLSLEGDFDDHFALYCPKGYERDALYIFTPDLMALLIDETGDFDVEIVDDRFFVYARGGWDLSNGTLWRRLDRIRHVVGAKAITRTDLYANARDPAAIAEGSRLRMGFFGGRSKVGLVLILTLGLTALLMLVGFGVFLLVFYLAR